MAPAARPGGAFLVRPRIRVSGYAVGAMCPTNSSTSSP